MAENSTFECEILLDTENVSGELFLFEIANIGLIGPSLALAPAADPADGLLDVVWVRSEDRKEWLGYLKHLGKEANSPAPVEQRRCRHITLRHSEVPLRVDGKVLPEVETPCCITVYAGALELIRSESFFASDRPLDQNIQKNGDLRNMSAGHGFARIRRLRSKVAQRRDTTVDPPTQWRQKKALSWKIALLDRESAQDPRTRRDYRRRR